MNRLIKLSFAILLLVSCNIRQEKASTALSTIGDSLLTSTSSHPIHDRLLEEMDSTEIYDDNVIFGMWFEPHAAIHHIIFHKDHSFEYDTFEFPNDSDIIDVTITGQFKVDGDSVYMWNDKGWKFALRYSPLRKGEKMKSLFRDRGKHEKWDYCFVKGSD